MINSASQCPASLTNRCVEGTPSLASFCISILSSVMLYGKVFWQCVLFSIWFTSLFSFFETRFRECASFIVRKFKKTRLFFDFITSLPLALPPVISGYLIVILSNGKLSWTFLIALKVFETSFPNNNAVVWSSCSGYL